MSSPPTDAATETQRKITLQIIESMRGKRTEELLEIWATHDRMRWSDTEFDAILFVLTQRGEPTNANHAKIVRGFAEAKRQRIAGQNLLAAEIAFAETEKRAAGPGIGATLRRSVAALRNIKLRSSVRLSLIIASGVCGGMLAYRLLLWLHESWEDLDNDNKSNLIAIAVVAAIAGLAFYLIRRLVRRRRVAPARGGHIAPPAFLYQGVKGWLLWLCVCLTFLGPLGSLRDIAADFALSDSGSGGVWQTIGLIQIAIVVFSIYSGISLWRLMPGAVGKAKLFLWACIAYNLISTPLILNCGLPVDRDKIVASAFAAVISCLTWLVYLDRSKRVRATYGLPWQQETQLPRINGS